ncbi:ferredoxin [Testicularia cyperi]|uniref:Ferredoxin n=1 Tax=Testicularia cyperi TaxID=1882483 RepID=A0A317XU20_9BASI|nr:ferredoxin [Testicularia cyperi]
MLARTLGSTLRATGTAALSKGPVAASRAGASRGLSTGVLSRSSTNPRPSVVAPWSTIAKNSLSASPRLFSQTFRPSHGGITRPAEGEGVRIEFVDSKGNTLKTVYANPGDDLLSIAHEYDIDLEGACEGSIACSTCHVILEPDVYDRLEEPGDDENDMLDLAFGLTDTSRLGCQVHISKDLDGMKVQLPAATRNMYVDGMYFPSPPSPTSPTS